jgi:hypothetical protein
LRIEELDADVISRLDDGERFVLYPNVNATNGSAGGFNREVKV